VVQTVKGEMENKSEIFGGRGREEKMEWAECDFHDIR
jgi:hypothetical protein